VWLANAAAMSTAQRRRLECVWELETLLFPISQNKLNLKLLHVGRSKIVMLKLKTMRMQYKQQFVTTVFSK